MVCAYVCTHMENVGKLSHFVCLFCLLIFPTRVQPFRQTDWLTHWLSIHLSIWLTNCPSVHLSDRHLGPPTQDLDSRPWNEYQGLAGSWYTRKWDCGHGLNHIRFRGQCGHWYWKKQGSLCGYLYCMQSQKKIKLMQSWIIPIWLANVATLSVSLMEQWEIRYIKITNSLFY